MLNVKTVTVLGANGTMGTNVSAIFASFGNAKVYMISRNIEQSRLAVERAGKSVHASSICKNLIPADYSSLDDCLQDSDLVFESVAENLDIKLAIHSKISQTIKNGTIVCTGTSGFSITRLAERYNSDMRSRFFWCSFF